MHRTPSGDRRQALQRTARELARDARALQKAAARAPAARLEAERLQGEADAALAQAEALKQKGLEDEDLGHAPHKKDEYQVQIVIRKAS
jgi:hypothetical protein